MHRKQNPSTLPEKVDKILHEKIIPNIYSRFRMDVRRLPVGFWYYVVWEVTLPAEVFDTFLETLDEEQWSTSDIGLQTTLTLSDGLVEAAMPVVVSEGEEFCINLGVSSLLMQAEDPWLFMMWQQTYN